MTENILTFLIVIISIIGGSIAGWNDCKRYYKIKDKK